MKNLNAPALARPAAVVRDRGDVADRRDGEAGGLERAQRRLAAGTRARHLDLERAHAVLHRLLRRVLGRHLRGERGRLARALEALRPRRRPGDGIALRVGNRDHGVVERGVDVRDARGDVFTFALAYARGFLAHVRPFRGCGPITEPKPSISFAPRAAGAGRSLLLSGDRLGRPLAGAGVGVSALTAHGKTAAMPQAAIAAEVHQPLDVHRVLTPQITFHYVVTVDHFANLQHFLVGELGNPARRRNAHLLHDFLGPVLT